VTQQLLLLRAVESMAQNRLDLFSSAKTHMRFSVFFFWSLWSSFDPAMQQESFAVLLAHQQTARDAVVFVRQNLSALYLAPNDFL